MGTARLLLAAALLAAAFTHAQAAIRVCGTEEPTLLASQTIQSDLTSTMDALVGTTNLTLAGARLAESARVAAASSGSRLGAAAAPASGVSVGVYVHIVRLGTGTGQGDVLDSTILTQIYQMNIAYFYTGVTFSLKATTRTTNPVWAQAQQNSQQWVDMTNALHQGGAADLNLYLLNLTYPLLGWSQFPWWYAYAPLQDGVFVDVDTLPGGAAAGFNLGNTAVHEAGHWLGLFHPFQGGCSNPGDYVADTSQEAGPEYNCVATPADSCPYSAGRDPISNFMDYMPDRCMYYFTFGQATRIAVAWSAYRTGGYFPAGSPGGRADSMPADIPTETRKATRRRPTKRRPTQRHPAKRPPTKRRPTARRPVKRPTRKPTQRQPTRRRPTKNTPQKRPTKQT